MRQKPGNRPPYARLWTDISRHNTLRLSRRIAMENVQTFPNPGAAVPTAPFMSMPKRAGRRLAGIAAGEPDRAGMLIAVAFVLVTLLAMTVALGYTLLVS